MALASIQVKDQTGEKVKATIPDWLPLRGWQFNHKGYLNFTSRAKRYGLRRGVIVQRAIFDKLVWLTPDERRVGPLFDQSSEIIWHVHHMDNDKRNNDPSNLLFVPHYFNPSPTRQCPWTGRRMSNAEWFRLYGQSSLDEVPF